MYGKEKSVGQVLTCSFCDTGFGVDPKIQGALKIDSTWKRMDGLQALVDKTNPQLGKVPVSDQPSREELFALLESVNERSNPYKLETGGGFVKGAIIGGLGLGLFSLLLTKLGLGIGLDEFGATFLGGLIGIFAGGIVSSFKAKFNYARDLAEEILIDAMHRNDLTVQMLKRALKHHPKSLRFASAAVTQLESA
jgi:hypothetical protein